MWLFSEKVRILFLSKMVYIIWYTDRWNIVTQTEKGETLQKTDKTNLADWSPIYLFNKHLLNVYFVPRNVPDVFYVHYYIAYTPILYVQSFSPM